MDQINTNFMLYEDSTRFLGIVELTLPTLTSKAVEMSGAGIAGSFQAIAAGHYDSFTIGIKFRTTSEDAITLLEPRRHLLEARVNQQHYDPATGQLEDVLEKHVFAVTPSSHNFGAAKPQSTSDGSGEYNCLYICTYLGGKKKLEIDPINYKCEIDGVDYLAAERANLGI